MKTALGRIRALAAFALAATALTVAHADDNYPSRAVRLIVPYGTGGGSDVLARQIATGLQQLWNQGVAVENKAGASGNIGTQEVVRATGDGYTLLLQNSTMATNLGVYGKLPYDPAKDLTPIMILGATPIALAAHPSLGVSNLKELVALAKAKPGSLSYANCGIGTPHHFAMELVKQKTGIEATPVGYKGCAPAVNDVLGGQVPLAILSANLVAPYAKLGKLKALGVTSDTRYALLPDTPTLEEQGLKPFDFNIWYALMGPANMPPAVVSKIAADVKKVLQDPRVKANLATAGVEPMSGDAAALTKLIREDSVRYVDLAKRAGIKPQ